MFSPFSQTETRLRDPSSPTNAEPMTMGSPVSSPQNNPKSPGQNFLPSYLFGEVSTPTGLSPSWNSPVSAAKRPRSSFQSTSFNSTPISQFKERQLSFQAPTSSVINSPNPSKSGAQPVHGLLSSSPTMTSFNVSRLDDISAVADNHVSFSGDNPDFSGVLTPCQSFSLNNTSFMSPAQIDPFYTQGENLKSSEQLDESWVTIFGFPPASSSYILQQFNQYGNIVEHKIPPNRNWMHVKYQSKLQAKKALSKHGKFFSGSMIIGVAPYIEMDLMESYKEKSIKETSTAPGSDRSLNELSEHNKPSLKNIRPLTQAYQSPNTSIQVTAQKPGGIVSKALEYIWKANKLHQS